MTEPFRQVLQAMREGAIAQQATHDALVHAAEANQRTGQAMVRAIEAVLVVKQEHDDVRDTVARLETLVLDLQQQLLDVRRRLPPTDARGGH
jgi:hypothetical protein